MPVENYALIFIGVCAIIMIATWAVYVGVEAVSYLRWGSAGVAVLLFAGCGVLLGVTALMAIGLFHFANS